MAQEEFAARIDDWVADALRSAKNLATESELREQAAVALRHFLEADIDGSASLSYEELKPLCARLGLPMSGVEEEALAKMDSDGSGALSVDEWVRWWIRRVSALPNPAKQQEVLAKNTFFRIDVDRSGLLDASEMGNLLALLGACFTADEVRAALREVDRDGSGAIDVDEFVDWWTARARGARDAAQPATLVSLKLKQLAARAAVVFHSDIFEAAWRGDERLVRSFVESEPRLALAADESDYGGGWRALHYAAYRGFRDVCALLLEHKAAVNAHNDEGFTALFYAAQQGRIDVCVLLMESGADPSLVGAAKDDETRFLCAADFVRDYPALRGTLGAHSKSTAPQRLSAKDLSATLSPAGQLAVSIRVAQRTLSALPLSTWRVTLSVESERESDAPVDDERLRRVSLVVRAAHPQRDQGVSAVVPRPWLRALHTARTRSLVKRLRWRDARADGLVALWAALRALHASLAENEPSVRRVSPAQRLRDALAADDESESDAAAAAIRRNFKEHLDKAEAAQSLRTVEDVDEVVRLFVEAAHHSATASQSQSRTKSAAKAAPPAVDFAAAAAPALAALESDADSALQLWLRVAASNGLFDGEDSDEVAVDVRFPSAVPRAAASSSNSVSGQSRASHK